MANPRQPANNRSTMRLRLAQPVDWLEAFREERRSLKGEKRRWLERYTPAARALIRSAGTQARGMKCNYVGAEHLLLGFLEAQNGVASEVLRGIGLTHRAVHAEVTAGSQTGMFYEGMSIPFTPRLKQICLAAQAAARSRAGSRVEPEDLLFALLGEGEGLPNRIFKRLGVDTSLLQERLRTPEI